MKNLDYLFAAYSIVWIGFFSYAFSLYRSQDRLMEEVRILKERVEKKFAK